MTKNLLVAAAVAIVLSVLFVSFRVGKDSPHPEAELITDVAVADDQASLGDTPSHPSTSGPSLRGRDADLESRSTLGHIASTDILEIERVATTATQVLDALATVDAERAMHVRKRLIDRCLPFNGDVRSRAKVSPDASPQTQAAQRRYIEHGTRFCSDGRLADIRTEIDNWHRDGTRSAKDGDDLSLAERLGFGGIGLPREDEIEFARDIALSSSDPYAVRSALAALGDGTLGRDAFAFLGVDDSRWATVPGENERIRAAAAEWYACELGANCTAFNPEQQGACLYQDNCAPDLDYRTFITTRLLSPTQVDHLHAYVEAFRAARRRGG